ncbi:hypothetical protein [Rhizobium sp. 007]|uniref:hypothetical protein n=1 Tax=Rhizobium sp. 007 TaxID=2785056 RepID=UPI001890772A|nr:hypothetical protein [Rhizobium sp. 007]QPB24234.1 hypothetical protein ISN39_32120 [Rhizobium sp. 007]
MLEARHGAPRRDDDRPRSASASLNTDSRPGRNARRDIIPAQPADRRYHDVTFLLELDERQDFLHQGASRKLPLGMFGGPDRHLEFIAGDRQISHNVFADLTILRLETSI